MTFSFNFALEDDSTTTSSISTTLSTPSIPSKRLRNGERFIYHPNATSMAFSPVHVGTQTFQIVNTTDAKFVTRTGVISSILITSDVQTNVYEGGFKLWECASTNRLMFTIKRHLRRVSNARALVAAKKYYFGTNGSVQHFVGLVQADGVFRAETVWEERDGRSNMREIVQLTYLDAAL
ncbi:hypothetical protein DD237_004926 [Peronospora effusa]|uniref:Uncharacterized protein n=1 Tax=Peronospora effusa TaxID=542832 RepID=A0A425C4X4_9STRA|nr:hypothetical protein DD237_004926 [Peronospora effusa]